MLYVDPFLMLGVRHCAAARRVCVQGVAVRTGPLVLAAVRAARPAFAFGVAGRAAQLPAAPSRRPACPAPAGAVSAPRRLLSQKVEARVGEGYQKGQLDDSTELVMEAPFGHESSDELAEKLGIYRVYEYEDSGRVSRVTVAFQSRAGLPAEVQSVEAHMALDSVHKLKQFPDGEVRGVSLPDDVTTHFRDLKVPFAVEIFESNTEGVSDTLVFAFETPGGFWTIGWHVPVQLFTQEPDLFFLFLQALRLKPRDKADK